MAIEHVTAPGEDVLADLREIELLFETLPVRVAEALSESPSDDLLEVVLDLGRQPTARHADREVVLSEDEVTAQDLDHVVAAISEFADDNRAGIPRTLHRISAIRNRRGRIVGLTCRVGRSVTGSAGAIRDLFEAGRSVLLLGAPGVGKTTMLREAARVLADDLNRRVVIVDTSNEIGGDGDIPHHAVGRARRMQVPHPELQHQLMIEAVENHMPEVIVIDEIGTALEATAARTIAERGVQLIGTAHGNTLHNLMQNPTLSDLIGGIESVTLGDEEARRRGTQKTVLERRAPPTFESLVEIQSFDRVAVHEDIGGTVDKLLRGFDAEAEVRTISPGGEVSAATRVPVPSGPSEAAAALRERESIMEPLPPAPGRAAASHPAVRREPVAAGAGDPRDALGRRGGRSRRRRGRGDDAASVLPASQRPAAGSGLARHPRLRAAQQHDQPDGAVADAHARRRQRARPHHLGAARGRGRHRGGQPARRELDRAVTAERVHPPPPARARLPPRRDLGLARARAVSPRDAHGR